MVPAERAVGADATVDYVLLWSCLQVRDVDRERKHGPRVERSEQALAGVRETGPHRGSVCVAPLSQLLYPQRPQRAPCWDPSLPTSHWRHGSAAWSLSLCFSCRQASYPSCPWAVTCQRPLILAAHQAPSIFLPSAPSPSPAQLLCLRFSLLASPCLLRVSRSSRILTQSWPARPRGPAALSARLKGSVT